MEVGVELRQVREQKAISLEALAAQTKIQRRILVAIEAGDWETLPEPVYIRGFVNRYATALGLDGATLSRQIPISAVVQSPKSSKSDFQPAAQLRPSHLYGIYVALIMAAVWGLSLFLQRPGEQRSPIPVAESSPSATESPNESASPVASPPSPSPESPSPESPAATASPSPETTAQTPPSSPDPQADDSPAAEAEATSGEDAPALTLQSWLTAVEFPDSQAIAINSKAVNVEVQIVSQAWVRVVVDGTVDFEGVLPEGTGRTWTADESLVVRSGNAGAVLLGFNGESPQPLGESGAVREITFGPQGASS